MRFPIRTATLTVTAAAGLALAPGASAGEVNPHIIGGSTVTSDMGAVALVQSSSSDSFCSASLLSATKVLTAKHCTDAVDSFQVRVGSLQDASGGTLHGISKVQTHNDVSVVTLSSAATGAKTVSLGTADPKVGDTNTIYGWGRTSYDGPGATSLKKANVKVTSLSAQDAFGGRSIQSSKGDGVAWKGDSGGPQLANGKQVGVASLADGSTTQIYASVAENLSFIRSAAGL